VSPRSAGLRRTTRTGGGTDLLALRRYAPGDSHRLIHWKASARAGRLLVRQFAAEAGERHVLWLRTDAAGWPRAEQFERAVSLAATLAEDLFRADRLAGVALDAGPPVTVRRGRDLEAWLDRLAVIAPRPAVAGEPAWARGGAGVITFAPDGRHAVSALLHGEPFATA
jgi:uncharacterized protein (DUF58 family)